MKPACPCLQGKKPFPLVECFFHAGFGDWRSHSSPFDDNPFRKFHDFSREFLLESARERAKEMAVFGLVIVVSAWPVIYMLITVVKLLRRSAALGL